VLSLVAGAFCHEGANLGRRGLQQFVGGGRGGGAAAAAAASGGGFPGFWGGVSREKKTFVLR